MFHVDLELDEVVTDAIFKKASDIHLEKQKEIVQIRFRIAGLLILYKCLPLEEGEKVMNRIKVLSALNIGEKRLPQDGRWDWQRNNLYITMRISLLPTIEGEKIVCRLLNNIGAKHDLADLGMDNILIPKVVELLKRPHGLTLICGPTGSGKTATLYAFLRYINLVEENVITLENPVESRIFGVVQVQVNEKIGLTFASGLRAILRQDPDTIIVGEIRDSETAALAVEAALTGHRVFSTIHTNTAIEVVERLKNMGIDEYLIEAVLNGALSQRLVRRFKEGKIQNGRVALFELLSLPQENKNIKKLNCKMKLNT